MYPWVSSLLPEGLCTKGEKPKAARRKPCGRSPHARMLNLLVLRFRGDNVDCAKNQFQPRAPREELETASPLHPGSPSQPGQYCESPSCSARFPDEGPAVVGPAGPLRKEGTKGILGSTVHLCLPLFCPPPLPSTTPSTFLSLKAPSQDKWGGRTASSPPAVLALSLISDMRTVQCKLTKCF